MEKDEVLQFVYKYAEENREKKPFRPGIDEVPVSGAVISPEDITAVVDAALDGWFTEGVRAKAFRDELRKFTGAQHVLLCNSGSSANLLAVSGLFEKYRAQKRRYIITCATAFPTTVAPILQMNCIPYFVDIDLETLNPDVDQVMDALDRYNDDVVGVILAHTLGFPFSTREIESYCKRKEKFFIEDCCDALGAYATLEGHEHVGNSGDVGTLSFFPAHHITTGEGGAVFCDDGDLYRIMRSYANWGRDCWCRPGESNTCNKRFSWDFPNLPEGFDHKYTFSRAGYNLKMTELQAALGLSQLEKASHNRQIRFLNWNYLASCLFKYHNHFHTIRGYAGVASPFGCPIIVTSDRFTKSEIVSFLEDRKIRTRPIFAGDITKHPMFDDMPTICHSTHNSDFIMNNAFWIGCHPGLSDKQLEYVIQSFEDFMKEKIG
jgi:CDP-6-deoxy-D-xylo-4-hexulose-3-dehydrase